MIKVSAQTFTASWQKSEINMRLSDLYDNFQKITQEKQRDGV